MRLQGGIRNITCNYCPNVGNVQAARVKSRAHSKEYKVARQETSTAGRLHGRVMKGGLEGTARGVKNDGRCSGKGV